jgi:hypothetical protein
VDWDFSGGFVADAALRCAPSHSPDGIYATSDGVSAGCRVTGPPYDTPGRHVVSVRITADDGTQASATQVADVRAAGRPTTQHRPPHRKSAPLCPLYHGIGIPRGSGIPPWGFHASQSFGGGKRGYAHGWGNVHLDRNLISGKICQDITGRSGPIRTIAVRVGPRISYHTHVAVMWGYPGNLIKTSLKVIASRDPSCKVGTHGRIVMYASYNGVRSDSMQFIFPRGCRNQNRLYHGRRVNAQVPPL